MNLTLKHYSDQTLGNLAPVEPCNGYDPDCVEINGGGGGGGGIFFPHLPPPLYIPIVPPRAPNYPADGSSSPSSSFSCLYGTPYRDESGEWRCPDSPNTTAVVPKAASGSSSNGTNAVSRPATVNVLGFEVSNTVLIVGAIGLGLILFSKGDK